MPRSSTCDQDLCRAAGLGEGIALTTKPELARTVIERPLDAGHHVGWVAGEEVYGGNPKLRSALKARGLGYVLAAAYSAEAITRASDHHFYDWAVIDLTEPGATAGGC